jgi:DNA-binding transcriptional LysR family regulator
VAFPQKMRRIEITPLMEDQPSRSCARPSTKLAGKKEIDLADLQGGKFIGFDQDIPTRKALDQFFREQRIEPRAVDGVQTTSRTLKRQPSEESTRGRGPRPRGRDPARKSSRAPS